jgi:hypothetical protein
VTWILDALCRTRPPDWWDLGDDGNRLAIALCSVCPVRSSCSSGDEEPHGVVRAGVAYRDTGERAQVCLCGRPIPTRRDRGVCFLCEPRFDVPVPVAKRRGRPSTAGEHLETIAALLRQDWTAKDIAKRIGLPVGTVQHWVRQYNLRPQKDPQAA